MYKRRSIFLLSEGKWFHERYFYLFALILKQNWWKININIYLIYNVNNIIYFFIPSISFVISAVNTRPDPKTTKTGRRATRSNQDTSQTQRDIPTKCHQDTTKPKPRHHWDISATPPRYLQDRTKTPPRLHHKNTTNPSSDNQSTTEIHQDTTKICQGDNGDTSQTPPRHNWDRDITKIPLKTTKIPITYKKNHRDTIEKTTQTLPRHKRTQPRHHPETTNRDRTNRESWHTYRHNPGHITNKKQFPGKKLQTMRGGEKKKLVVVMIMKITHRWKNRDADICGSMTAHMW